MYAVAGVSGNTGAVVAQTLLDRGEAVRVIVRDAEKGRTWAERGAEVAVADLSDVDALAAALEGTAGFYSLVPPQYGASDPIAAGAAVGRGLVEASRRAGTHFVLLSSIGAQQPTGTGPIEILHRTEEAAKAAGIRASFLRAGYFFENYGMLLQPITTDGVLPTYIAPGTPMSTVTVADIGRQGAALLLDPPASGQRVVELAGPSDPTPEDVAAAFSKVLGRPVQVVAPPLESVVPTFEGMGLPTAWAKLYEGLYRGVAEGRVATAGPVTRGVDDVETAARRLLGQA
ncbi:MAG: NmrA family NAD(P)-binding protein [Alphaproteobacteria bacterium]|nr:NmrA family NAD(P)-binding protein [Alphaproteobacteria bacterium]